MRCICLLPIFLSDERFCFWWQLYTCTYIWQKLFLMDEEKLKLLLDLSKCFNCFGPCIWFIFCKCWIFYIQVAHPSTSVLDNNGHKNARYIYLLSIYAQLIRNQFRNRIMFPFLFRDVQKAGGRASPCQKKKGLSLFLIFWFCIFHSKLLAWPLKNFKYCFNVLQVRITEGASLYSLCRSWLRNGAHEGVQVHINVYFCFVV